MGATINREPNDENVLYVPVDPHSRGFGRRATPNGAARASLGEVGRVWGEWGEFGASGASLGRVAVPYSGRCAHDTTWRPP